MLSALLCVVNENGLITHERRAWIQEKASCPWRMNYNLSLNERQKCQKTRCFPRFAVNATVKHISEEPLNQGVEPIEGGSGGGGIRTHGGYSPHTISSRAH